MFLGLSLTVEVNKKLDLGAWAVADYLAKQVEIQLKPVVEGGRSRRVKLFDAHLVTWKTNFSAVDNRPMSETLFITATGVEDTHSAGVYSAKWRKTFSGEAVEPATLERPEKKLTRYYLTNTDNQEISTYKVGQTIVLNLITENRIGDVMTIDLNDPEYDFEYNGTPLKDDILQNYVIGNDTEQIPLKVIQQKNQN
ncbi:MAG: hypothetical protein CSA40_02095 [Flavobacteriales bacterium]|nr:MAG: hypothetical protein CSA40_02095 [Flavobacteriales bacterium]